MKKMTQSPWQHALLLLLSLLLLSVGCGDEKTTGKVIDVKSGQDTLGVQDTSADTTEVDVPTCSAEEDDICLGLRQRQICQEDGTLLVENCEESQNCFDGVCGDIICDAYRVDSCAGFRYLGCNAAGTAEGEFDCADGLTCIEDACVARFCAPGEVRCKNEAGNDGDEFSICNEAGTAFIDEGNKCTDNDIKSICDGSAEVHECKSLCDAIVKNASYIGCDYWAVDLDNSLEGLSDGTAGAIQVYAVVISNTSTELPANIKVYDAEGYNADPRAPMVTVEVPPGELTVIPLPPDCYDLPPSQRLACSHPVNNTMLGPAAYRIISDLPITAYQFNPLDNSVQAYSNDASLLFPQPSLGVRYIAMAGGTKWASSPGFVTVVGASDEPVEVTIKPSIRTMPGRRADGTEIPAMEPGESYQFTLKPFDVLNIASGREDNYDPLGNAIPLGDLTGTEIIATGRIAVFGGTECTEVPNTNPRSGACDHLEQQIYPVSSWGQTYHAAKSWPRGASRDFWHVLARQDNTIVTTTPEQPNGSRTINAGDWYTIPSSESFEIKANHPILVGQFLAGENDPLDRNLGPIAGIGDPAFILGVPLEQYRSDYLFLAPNAYATDYVTIVARVGAQITLDDVLLTPEVFEQRNALIEDIGDSGYEAIRVLIADGTHHLTAAFPDESGEMQPEPVGVYVYGFDNYVSYGYPAGLNLGDASSNR